MNLLAALNILGGIACLVMAACVYFRQSLITWWRMKWTSVNPVDSLDSLDSVAQMDPLGPFVYPRAQGFDGFRAMTSTGAHWNQK